MKIADVQELLTEAKYYNGPISGTTNAKFRTAVDKITDRNRENLYGPLERFNDARKIVAAGQLVLRAMGYVEVGNIDGDAGPKTAAALQRWRGLSDLPSKPQMPTESVADPALTIGVNPKFDKESAARVKRCLPPLRAILNAARDKIEFYVSDSLRGEKAQEDAFRRKASKAHFGQSAHNYDPPLAVDVWPKKNVDWNDLKAFKAVHAVIGWYEPKTGQGSGVAKQLRIPLRWGGDWNMNGKDEDGWDLPHHELYPWREFAKQSKLYKG